MNGQHPIRRDIGDICPVKWKTSFRCYPPGVARIYGGKLLKLARVYIRIYPSFFLFRYSYPLHWQCSLLLYCLPANLLSLFLSTIHHTSVIQYIYASFVSVWRFDIFLIRLIYICFLFVNCLNNSVATVTLKNYIPVPVCSGFTAACWKNAFVCVKSYILHIA